MSRKDGRRKATRQEALLSVAIHDKDQQLGLPVFTAEDKSKAPSLCASGGLRQTAMDSRPLKDLYAT